MAAGACPCAGARGRVASPRHRWSSAFPMPVAASRDPRSRRNSAFTGARGLSPAFLFAFVVFGCQQQEQEEGRRSNPSHLHSSLSPEAAGWGWFAWWHLATLGNQSCSGGPATPFDLQQGQARCRGTQPGSPKRLQALQLPSFYSQVGVCPSLGSRRGQEPSPPLPLNFSFLFRKKT